MAVVAIDVGQRLHCGRCDSQDFARERFELQAGELDGLDAISWLARRAGLLKDPSDEVAQGEIPESPPNGETILLPGRPLRVGEQHPSPAPGAETLELPGQGAESEGEKKSPSSSELIRAKRGSTERSAFVEKDLSDSSKLGLGILPESARVGVYAVQTVIGQGGMGVVYEAHDSDLERNVALKVLSRELCRNPRFIDRFRREARAAARLNHPNITHVYSIGEEAGNHYFVMELVRGTNLADLVAKEGPLPIRKAVDITRQTAQGLRAAAQSQIIHRDVKPSNLLVTSDGEVKITDFGLAKAIMGSAVELTTTGVVMGTPVYMSPEQGRGKDVDARSDIYSLGATLYFLLIGKPPFEGDSPIAIILKHLNEPLRFPEGCELPGPLRSVIIQMMRKDAQERYQDYDSLIEDLERLLLGEEVNALMAEAQPQIIVFNYKRTKESSDLFRVGKISLARTNLKLGRRDKALTLLHEVLDASSAEPGLHAEAGLILLDLYERERDWVAARRVAESVARSKVEGASSYAIWKLARFDELDALTRLRSAATHYDRLLLHASPEHRPVIDRQLANLKERIQEMESSHASHQVVLFEG